MTTSATVSTALVHPDVLARARDRAVDIVVMPVRESDGRGIYSEASLSLVKELRAAGITSAYLHDPDHRLFETQKSASAVVANFLVGIASGAAWDGLKMVLRRRGAGRLTVSYVDLADGNTESTAWTASGDAEAVLAAIERLRPSDE